MKQSIKQTAARIAISASKALSECLPKPTVLIPADVEAIEKAFASQWHHFGIVDNWYTEDDIRWKTWDDLATAKIAEMKALRGETEGKRLIEWGGEYVYV